MKLIKLTQNKYAIVDDEDFEYLSQWKWHFHSTGYARTSNPKLYMHRLILKLKKGGICDHINRDRLDNRKSNLRIVNPTQNMINTSLRSDNSSGHKGISWSPERKRWQVYITLYKKTISLGRYKDLSSAILARQLGERTYHA